MADDCCDVLDDDDPFEDLTDEQVLARAERALRKVVRYPIGSFRRAIQWEVYKQAKAELDLRFWGYVTRRVMEKNDDPGTSGNSDS